MLRYIVISGYSSCSNSSSLETLVPVERLDTISGFWYLEARVKFDQGELILVGSLVYDDLNRLKRNTDN